MYILDETIPIQKYFEDICRLPHGSGNEKAVSDYVVSFAGAHELEYVRDEYLNVVVRKKASEGYENSETVMLEAHMDMVCIKETGSKHDFEKDPLDLKVENGVLYAKGTTLGADDGYGVAWMLAVLADDTLFHPALECVFTVQEETNCIGALMLDKSRLKATRMIGLDCNEEYDPYTGSFCSDRIIMTKEPVREQVSGSGLTICLHDLNGHVLHGVGHHDCGNAVIMTARFLMRFLEKDVSVRILNWNGGTLENHIPTESVCTVLLEGMTYPAAEEIIRSEYDTVFREYLSDRYSGILDISRTEVSGTALSARESRDLVRLLTLMPSNRFMAGTEDNELEALNNLGILRMEQGTVTLTMSHRSRYKSAAREILTRMEILADLFAWDIKTEERYQSWPFREDSPLRDAADAVLTEETGRPFGREICPGGLEIGIFLQAMPDLDVIELGCDHRNLHTTEECLDLGSFSRGYDRLVRILARLR